ncbi:MAG: ABC transporter ATP-binding protein [Acidobacteriota bacterium]
MSSNPSAAPQPLLATEGLAAGYDGRRSRTVLAQVSLRLDPGELVVVLGPNGAGKSTLLRTLAGMLRPLKGTVEVSGQAVDGLSPSQRARLIGVVLPERVTPGMLSAYDLVGLGRYPHTSWAGGLRREDEEIIRWALRAVGIAHLATRDVAALSDGERQKVMIARALAQEPRVLILDEPTAFLDLPGRVDVMSLLGRLARRGDGDRAVLLSTHDLDLALRSADRVWLLDRKGDLQSGTPAELLAAGAFQTAFESEELSRYLPRAGALERDPPSSCPSPDKDDRFEPS